MIKLENVSKVYRISNNDYFYALKNINLNIRQGEFVVILGRSGSGKTTLLNILSKLDEPTEGIVLYHGESIDKLTTNTLLNIRNQQFGYIFQSFYLEPEYTAFDNVSIPALIARNKTYKHKVIESLDLVGLLSKQKIKAKNLSGGEQQRVAIARALVNDPQVIFADEPTGNLDSYNHNIIMSLLKKLHENGKTIILVTHDESNIKYATKVIRIKDGVIEWQT